MFLFLFFLLPVISWSVSQSDIDETFKYVEKVKEIVQRHRANEFVQKISKNDTKIREQLATKYPRYVVLTELIPRRDFIERSRKEINLVSDPRWNGKVSGLPPPPFNDAEFAQADDILKKMTHEILHSKKLSKSVLDILTQLAQAELMKSTADILLKLKQQVLPRDSSLADSKFLGILEFLGLSSNSDDIDNYIYSVKEAINNRNSTLSIIFKGEVKNIREDWKSRTIKMFKENPTTALVYSNISLILPDLKSVSFERQLLVDEQVSGVPDRPSGFDGTLALVEGLMDLPLAIEELKGKAGSESLVAEAENAIIKMFCDSSFEIKYSSKNLGLLQDLHIKVEAVTPIVVEITADVSPVIADPIQQVDNDSSTVVTSPDPPVSPSAPRKSASTALVVGLVVGGVALAVGIAVVVLLLKRRASAETPSPV